MAGNSSHRGWNQDLVQMSFTLGLEKLPPLSKHSETRPVFIAIAQRGCLVHMAKKAAGECIQLGREYTFPGISSPVLLRIDDLTTHVLIFGGTPQKRTALTQKIVEEALRLKRKVLVISTNRSWSEVLGRRKNVMVFDGPMQNFTLRRVMGVGRTSCAVFQLEGHQPQAVDSFLAEVLADIFRGLERETNKLELLLVLDEVYDKVAGLSFLGPFEEIPLEHGLFRSQGVLWLERGVRELRKFGRGIVITSARMGSINEETLSNVWTLIHLGSKDSSEVEAARMFFENSEKIMELGEDTGLMVSPNCNYGQPLLVKFDLIAKEKG